MASSKEVNTTMGDMEIIMPTSVSMEKMQAKLMMMRMGLYVSMEEDGGEVDDDDENNQFKISQVLGHSSEITLKRSQVKVENKIRGRKHWGYISGKKVAPATKTSDEYETWEDENCLVKSWLLDAMTKDVKSLFIRLPTPKKIWESVKETYFVNQDASKAYQLYCEVISIKQDGGSVVTYFAKLQKLWQEIDAIEDCTMVCNKDVETYTNKLNAQRVYIFLAGLDSHLDGVRG
ncbi:uncharacterized protein [Medicago truncatula]|uniref:uncharacterized protein n=1 Tax=Medicago truncatula TaxID=3880 RepID=UPI000D2F2DFC|nr:uncharacterized protein LOC112420057 [Medicago truncatula]